MNYEPVLVENQANKSTGLIEANNSAGTQANDDQGDKIEKNIDFKTCEKPNASTSSTNLINTASTPLSTAGPSSAFNDSELLYPDDPLMPYLEDIYACPNFPFGKKAIGTKWVYRKKKDESDIVVRYKVRLVAQGHWQEEGRDCDEVFAHVARIEAIRIFLAFASYMGFIVYQMDVKNAFLYGTIDEEVYVLQPPGFIDPKFPNKSLVCYFVYFLGEKWYRRGAIDKTLIIKPDKKDIMLVQVYVDDIIFGSTKKYWCDEFKELMNNRFQMSSMGELTFFLGLQVKQKEDGIFINQDKYVAEILKKFDFLSVKTASTLVET
nr:copia protein [Tanacetum cinerariifolium]